MTGLLAGERIAIVTKTPVGAKWIEPLVAQAKRSGATVHAYLPDSPGDLAERLAAHGADVTKHRALTGNPAHSLLDLPSFRRELLRFSPTVINYFLFRAALVSRFASLGMDTVKIHSVVGPLIYESKLANVVERTTGRLDDFVLAGSKHIEREAIKTGRPTGRVLVVRYGADMGHFQPPTAEARLVARQHLGLRRDEPVFVMVAYWYGKKRLGLGGRDLKGHDVALRAWQIYKEAGGEGRLVFVGGQLGNRDTSYRTAAIEQVEENGALRDIIVLDTVEDVRAAYSAADASLSPSRSENYGATIEASAMGVPSLASDVGAMPEVVLPGRTGWTFPPGSADALAQTLDQAANAIRTGHARTLGRHARKLVEHDFDTTHLANEYVRALAQALDSRHRSS